MITSIRHRTSALTAALGLTTVGVVLAATPAGAVAQRSAEPTWGTNGRVLAIAVAGDRVYVAGQFTAVTDTSGVSYPVSNVALFIPSTGQFDPTWHPAVDGAVSAIAASGSRVFLGGSFNHVDGTATRKLAAVDPVTGAVDKTWKTTVNKPIDSLALSGGYLYLGGRLTMVKDTSGKHTVSFTARVNATTGAWDNAWQPSPNARVRAVLPSADGSHIFLGGQFTKVSGQPSTRFLASVTTSGTVDPSFVGTAINRGNPAQVNGLATDGTSLLIAAAGVGGACTALNAANGSLRWSKNTNGDLQAVSILNGTAYCGGHFNGSASFDGQTRYKLAAVDLVSGTTLSFNPRINSAKGVWSMATDPGRLFVGGDFTLINKAAQPHLAVFLDR